ncbi:MAG: hypothetical protein GY757_16395, partial [bacterium]|nr:hypothetical protein [bacterium]
KSIEVLLGLIDNGGASGDCFLSNAAWVLGELKAHSAVNTLIDLLQHQKTAVRLSAIEALGNLKAKTATPPLIKIIKTESDPGVKKKAFLTLAEWGNRDTADFFYQILKEDPNLQNREAAATALGQMKDDRVIEGLKDPDASVRNAVYNTFRTFKSKKTMKHLLMLFESPGVQENWKATTILSENPHPGYAGYFIRCLKNSSESFTRSASLRILKQYPRHPDIEAAYFDALWDSNSGVRSTALMALADYFEPDSLESILSLMENKDAKKRVLGASLANTVRDTRILTPLINLLKDNEFYVRDTAIRTLYDYLRSRDRLRVMKSINEEFAAKTKKALSQITDPAIIRYLVEYLERRWFSSYAEDILTVIKPQSVVPRLITQLKQGNYALIPLLGNLGDRRAVDALHEVLSITFDDLEKLYKAKEKDPEKRDKYMKKIRKGYLETIQNTFEALAVIGEHGSFQYIKPFLMFSGNIIKKQKPLAPAGRGEDPFSKESIVTIQRAAGHALIDLAHPDSVDSIIEFVRKEGPAFESLLLYIIWTKKAGDVKKILRHITSPGLLLLIADSCSIDELKSVQIKEKIAPYLQVLRNNKQKKQTHALPAASVTGIPALTLEDGYGIYKDRAVRSYAYQLGREYNTKALVELVARLRHPGWTDTLFYYFKNNRNLHETVIEIFSRVKDKRITDLFIPVLKNEDAALLKDYQKKELREQALRVLAAQKDSSAIPHLAQALADEEQEIRVKVCQALGATGDPAAVPYLRKHLEHREFYDRVAAKQALCHIPGTDTPLSMREIPARRAIGVPGRDTRATPPGGLPEGCRRHIRDIVIAGDNGLTRLVYVKDRNRYRVGSSCQLINPLTIDTINSELFVTTINRLYRFSGQLKKEKELKIGPIAATASSQSKEVMLIAADSSLMTFDREFHLLDKLRLPIKEHYGKKDAHHLLVRG